MGFIKAPDVKRHRHKKTLTLSKMYSIYNTIKPYGFLYTTINTVLHKKSLLKQ